MSETVPVVRGDDLVEKVAWAMVLEDPIPMQMFSADEVRDLARAALSVAIEEAARVAIKTAELEMGSYRSLASKIASAIRALGRGEG